jgi:hypothetical protein
VRAPATCLWRWAGASTWERGGFLGHPAAHVRTTEPTTTIKYGHVMWDVETFSLAPPVLLSQTRRGAHPSTKCQQSGDGTDQRTWNCRWARRPLPHHAGDKDARTGGEAAMDPTPAPPDRITSGRSPRSPTER